jgi:hypothetical protein
MSTRYWYYEMLAAARRQQNLELAQAAATEVAPPSVPAPVLEQPQVIHIRDVVVEEPTMTHHEPNPSSMAWMMILVMCMGCVSLVVLGFIVMILAGVLVPGLGQEAGTGVIP